MTYLKYLTHNDIHPFQGRKKLTDGQVEILEKYFPFYQSLDPDRKSEFRNRVAQFIGDKEFVPREMSEITDEMRVLISATAVQITFGFIPIKFQYFQYIIVYPETFYSHHGENFHHGEVNPKHRAIVLSWKNFALTMSRRDGKNLGLHEMAHALRIENVIRNREFNFLNRYQLAKWEVLALKEIEKIRKGYESLFRDYAATNDEEFFAVAVEVFFELPEEFLRYHPQLFQIMASLLNQNPLR